MTENVPVKWDEELARQARALVSQERPAVGNLSFKGGVITYEKQILPSMNVIILGVAFEHALYENVVNGTAYNQNDQQPPICYALAPSSASGEKPVMVPHAQAEKKASTDCLSCQFFQWGSRGGGSRGKACQERRRLLLLGESAIAGTDASIVKKAEAAKCSVPATSLKNWANYVAMLAGQYSMPPWAFVTKITLERDPKTQFQVKFELIRPVPREFYDAVWSRTKAAEAILTAPYGARQQRAPQAPRQGVNY